MCATNTNASTDTSTDANVNANANENAIDHTTEHIWMFEWATSENNTKSLSDTGVGLIAAHKYKPGKYTFLDNFLNPFWTGLTELLPMWLAPNAVTLIGFAHCALSYFVTWYHSPNFDKPLPDWVVFLSGYCTLAYYTFDCMDGKQARRTGQSSPLGQLFDHGFDCISNLTHCSTQAGYLMVGGTAWFSGVHGSLFFAFFMAQWEEYYTGELPHAMGNFGVTEVNYGLGAFAIFNSFIDREQFWTRLMGDILPEAVSAMAPSFLVNMELRHFGLSGWMVTSSILIMGSFYRVLTHEFVTSNNLRFSAVTKLSTPFLIAVAPFWLPDHVIANETRPLSICLGLLMSFLTVKMICFSMAKQQFAAIQMEAFPYFGLIVLMKCDDSNHTLINEMIAKVLMAGLCVWYLYRLVSWAKTAIDQICERLDIYCLSIKHPKHNKAA